MTSFWLQDKKCMSLNLGRRRANPEDLERQRRVDVAAAEKDS
jgi:hypothetical protein